MQIENQHAADDPTATLLERLLAERLPRRRRCGSCVAFEAAAADALEGACAARVPPTGGCAANDRCTAWEPLQLEWYEEESERCAALLSPRTEQRRTVRETATLL